VSAISSPTCTCAGSTPVSRKPPDQMNPATLIDDLIAEAEALKSESFRSPRIKLWKHRAREFVAETYGDAYVKILSQTLFFRRVISSDAEGNRMHREAMDGAITFLEGLRDEPTAAAAPDDAPTELHPAIHELCLPLFESGHYAEAVEKSFKVVRDRLRALTGYETGSEAFGKGNLRIEGAAAAHVAHDFNEGVKFLTMTIDKFRNEKSHTSDGQTTDPNRASEYISMSSLAMHLLDQAEIAE
jgi:uncharacterized protein (TIGR02391 family)